LGWLNARFLFSFFDGVSPLHYEVRCTVRVFFFHPVLILSPFPPPFSVNDQLGPLSLMPATFSQALKWYFRELFSLLFSSDRDRLSSPFPEALPHNLRLFFFLFFSEQRFWSCGQGNSPSFPVRNHSSPIHQRSHFPPLMKSVQPSPPFCRDFSFCFLSKDSLPSTKDGLSCPGRWLLFVPPPPWPAV